MMSQVEDRKYCGASQILEEALKDPKKKQILEQLEIFTKDFIATLDKETRGGTYIIPVVVHVIHNYGPERISISQVDSAIETMNNDFNALNDDITGVINEFTDLISDIGIEFRLAKLDEKGNCTNGITYHQSVLTYEGGENVKSDTYWNNDMYMNIWVVADLASEGTAAYAYYPGSAPDNHEGIIRLNEDSKIGQSYSEIAGLDDVVIEIGITPNRQDCLGVFGIARDLAASGLGKLKIRKNSSQKGSFKSPIDIETKNTKIFMYEEEKKVKIKSLKNHGNN